MLAANYLYHEICEMTLDVYYKRPFALFCDRVLNSYLNYLNYGTHERILFKMWIFVKFLIF